MAKAKRVLLVALVLTLGTYGCQSQGSLQNLQSQIAALKSENENLKAENTNLIASKAVLEKQLSDDKADSSQETLIYDSLTLFGGPQLRWKIPRKVQPVVVGSKAGAYYRYRDPKTNIGTDNFAPQSQ